MYLIFFCKKKRASRRPSFVEIYTSLEQIGRRLQSPYLIKHVISKKFGGEIIETDLEDIRIHKSEMDTKRREIERIKNAFEEQGIF